MTNEDKIHAEDTPLADPLEASAPADLEAARRDAYWTKGCGADVLKRDAKLARIARLEKMLADATKAFDHAVGEAKEWADVAERAARVMGKLSETLAAERGEMQGQGGVKKDLGSESLSGALDVMPRFPVGTPEYAAYRSKLQEELSKFARGQDPYPYLPIGHVVPGGRVIPAPVNSVDIRTAEEYGKGMTNLQLSDRAKNTIKGMPSDRIGSVVVASDAVRKELREAGLIGMNDGLTIKGSAQAAKLQSEHLDDLFGKL